MRNKHTNIIPWLHNFHNVTMVFEGLKHNFQRETCRFLLEKNKASGKMLATNEY
jgi:hypothetical protein